MSAGITIDPQQLNNFASGVQDLITTLKNLKSSNGQAVLVPPVKFGQDADYPPELCPPAAPALMLAGRLQNRITDFEDNFQTLINKLTLLADTAGAIAKHYTTAAELDHLSASAVGAMLTGSAPAAGE